MSHKYIVVNLKSFYKYFYLGVFKKLFSENYIYGNLSPILPENFNIDYPYIKEIVFNSLYNNKEIKTKLSEEQKENIKNYYKIDIKKIDIKNLDNKLKILLKQMIVEV